MRGSSQGWSLWSPWLVGLLPSLFLGCGSSDNDKEAIQVGAGGDDSLAGSIVTPPSNLGGSEVNGGTGGISRGDPVDGGGEVGLAGGAGPAVGGNESAGKTSEEGGASTPGGGMSSEGGALLASGGVAVSKGGADATPSTGGAGAPGMGGVGAENSLGGSPNPAQGGAALAEACGKFPRTPTQTGTLFKEGLEASGMVASRKQPGVYYVHGDSSPMLYAIDATGRELGEWEVTSDARFFFIYNWEDIAIESTTDGPDRIWVGDIGNHTEDAEGNPVEPRPNLRLLSIEEPTVDPSQITAGTAPVIEDLTFEYPEGMFDAEALLMDPANKDLFVVSKVADPPSKIHRIRYPYASSTLEVIGTLDLDSINGGDISPSGRELVLRNYGYVHYWARPEGSSWNELLSAQPSTPEQSSLLTFTQNYFSEAICFPLDESGFYVVSEEQPGAATAPSPIEFYPKDCE